MTFDDICRDHNIPFADRREIESLASRYWADKIDPDEARREIFNLVRMAKGIDLLPGWDRYERGVVEDVVNDLIEASMPDDV